MALVQLMVNLSLSQGALLAFMVILNWQPRELVRVLRLNYYHDWLQPKLKMIEASLQLPKQEVIALLVSTM